MFFLGGDKGRFLYGAQEEEEEEEKYKQLYYKGAFKYYVAMVHQHLIILLTILRGGMVRNLLD